MSGAAKQLWLLTGLSAAMVVAGLVWAGFETRLFQDTLVWIKPFKFALSFVAFFATLAWAVQNLSEAVQKRRALAMVVAIFTAAFWFEMTYISMQAAQGRASHYNVGDWYHGMMYAIMGGGAVLLMLGAGLIGWFVLRDTGAESPPI